jgi:glutamine amidotransferase
MIAIIDYGMGNIHSVQKALALHGAATLVTNKAGDVRKCDKLILPGVGAFADAMAELKKQDLVSVIKGEIKNKKLFLGICLGMQLLFEKSQEAAGVEGLGILAGEVRLFDRQKGIKVPHMGWNQLSVKKAACPLLKNIPPDSFVYFCHSYYPRPDDESIVAARTHYGGDFAALVWQENVFGVQFHPEKSQEVGLLMLKNFVEM